MCSWDLRWPKAGTGTVFPATQTLRGHDGSAARSEQPSGPGPDHGRLPKPEARSPKPERIIDDATGAPMRTFTRGRCGFPAGGDRRHGQEHVEAVHEQPDGLGPCTAGRHQLAVVDPRPVAERHVDVTAFEGLHRREAISAHVGDLLVWLASVRSPQSRRPGELFLTRPGFTRVITTSQGPGGSARDVGALTEAGIRRRSTRSRC